MTKIQFSEWQLLSRMVRAYSASAIFKMPDEFASNLDSLDADVRAMAYLHVLWDGLGQNGLHAFFQGKAARHASGICRALETAGLAKEHRLFSAAMASFGNPYPIDDKERKAHFAFTSSCAEPNSFDRQLLAIEDEFGGRKQLRAAILEHVHRTPLLVQRIAFERTKVTDPEKLFLLMSSLLASLDFWQPYESLRDQLHTLDTPRRALTLLAALMQEISNGGIHQFFYNSAGCIAPEVTEVLGDLKLPAHRCVMATACEMFDIPYPRDTTRRREAYFHNREPNEWDDRLQALTDEFYAADVQAPERAARGPSVLSTAMLDIARSNDLL